MDEFRRMAVEQAINELFSKRYFSICAIDTIIKLTNVIPNHKVYEELNAFHCVHYSQMSDRTRQLIQEKVVECLRGDPVMNPARMTNMLLDEGKDFTFTEDRFLDKPL